MPPFELMDRHQKAVYWRIVATTRDQSILLADPVEKTVRWVPVRSNQLDSEGQKIGHDVTVILDFCPEMGSLFKLGSLASLPSGTGSDLPGLHEVVTVSPTPSLDARIVRYEAKLKRYGDTLPQVL